MIEDAVLFISVIVKMVKIWGTGILVALPIVIVIINLLGGEADEKSCKDKWL